jgi:hypothetical protein
MLLLEALHVEVFYPADAGNNALRDEESAKPVFGETQPLIIGFAWHGIRLRSSRFYHPVGALHRSNGTTLA